MASANQSDSPSLNTINNLFGTSLEFPKCFRKPGTASLFEAKTGSGHLGSRGGALEANPGPLSPIAIDSLGINNHTGMQNITGALTVTGQALFLGGFKGTTSYWSLDTGAYSITSGSIGISGKKLKLSSPVLAISGKSIYIDGDLYQTKKLYWDKKKDFDILHPTKSGWRLRHVCIEGPTADVFVKGVLNNNKNIIELPEYWVGLVDSETIVVTLTPIGTYQELFVEKIENNKIFVKNNSSSAIKCNYFVCAERKDTEKNIPEYEGTYDDYPGDNSQYLGSILNILKSK